MIAGLLWSLCAHAAELPGVAIPFDVGPTGQWTLPAELPAHLAHAGVQPGWGLTAIDGVKFTSELAAQQQVGRGPARPVQLHFATPEGETVVVVNRGPLIQLEEVGLLPWPEGFAAARHSWVLGEDGSTYVVDGADLAWRFEAATGKLNAEVDGAGKTQPIEIPEVWWALAEGTWSRSTAGTFGTGNAAWARAQSASSLRLNSFQGQSGDHLLQPTTEGLEVWAVAWPRGTPELPVCNPEVPESCLVGGRKVAAELVQRPGGKKEAQRMLGLACQGGVYRACLESVALSDPNLSGRAAACIEKDANACHDLARDRLKAEPERPGEVLVGVLEYACSVDASGSLGQRLRRLEEVGEGCMMLAGAFDRQGIGDRALLSLDQACVLGRAEACEEADRRRKEAFALRTARECQDPDLPLASSCVQLGLQLQKGPIKAARLDDFDAFLRACELGDEEGCVYLGDYVDRWGIGHARVVGAEQRLEGSCKQGEQRACVGAAHLLVRHEPRSPAYGRALTLFSAACTAGIPSACIAGAEQRRIGAARKIEAPEPESLWQSACDLSSPEGCAGLGERLARSKKTWDAAYTAWTRACETGEASACTDLGLFVVEKHEPAWPGEQQRSAYLSRGCDNGDAEGCYWLASDQIPKKEAAPEPAYLLLERSCQGDFGQGCAVLGQIHLDRKTSFDDELAARRFEEACDNGHFESCKTLGEMYQKGKGVEKDRVRAKEFAQRYSINARRRHLRLGAHVGFPYVAGADGEVVLPIPVGPAIAGAGSYTWLPGLGGAVLLLEGDDWPADSPPLTYWDAGLRLYPNNKARGLYAMAAWHSMEIEGADRSRSGPSLRLGMHTENKLLYSRVEMGIGQYGMVNLRDYSPDASGEFPLIQATLGLSFGIAPPI